MPAGAGDGRLLDRRVRRWTAVGTSIAVVSFWLLGTLGQPWHLFRFPNAITANFYDLQARALLDGGLSVPAGSLLAEEFVTARGSMMYFGIFPAVLRVPFHLVADGFDGRLTLFSCLVAVAVLSVSSARIARRAQLGVLGADVAVSPRWYAVVSAAPVVCTPVLFLGSRSVVYHENVLWGVAGTVLALSALQQWWWSRRDRDLVVVALAAAVAVHSRPSVGLAPLFALGILGCVLAVRREGRALVRASVAFALVAGSYMAVNFARFGQLWGAPHELQVSYGYSSLQQAAGDMTGGSLFSWRFMVNNAVRYFDPSPSLLSPTRLFPFVEFGPAAGNVVAAPMNIQFTGSVPTAAPLLAVLGVIGMVWVWRARTALWLAPILGAGVASATTLGFWSSWHRYLGDFTPLLVVAAAPGAWCAIRWMNERSRNVRAALAVAVLAATVVAAWGQVGLGLWARHFAYLPDAGEQEAFVRMRYSLDRRLFDEPSPDVEHVVYDPRTPLPDARLGHLLVVDGCAGLYVGGFGWEAMELPSGAGHRAVMAPTRAHLLVMRTAPTTVLDGDGWILRSRPVSDPALLGLYYVNRFGKEVGVGVAKIDDGPPLLDVTADPVTRRFSVSQEGRSIISISGTSAGGMEVGDGWNTFEERSALCDTVRSGLPASVRQE